VKVIANSCLWDTNIDYIITLGNVFVMAACIAHLP
jgi:hypothetical protein